MLSLDEKWCRGKGFILGLAWGLQFVNDCKLYDVSLRGLILLGLMAGGGILLCMNALIRLCALVLGWICVSLGTVV